jgi:SAM-dependent methyltransferase
MKDTTGWDWNRALREMPGRWTEVADEMFSFSNRLREAGCRRVYDLGCGAGRHTVFLARQGFEVTASDLSESALEITRASLDAAGVEARLLRLDMAGWPFADGCFDALVAFNVVYHARREQIEKLLGEVHRVLAPGGQLFITLKSTLDADYARGRELAPFTRAPTSGIETGVAHYYVDEGEMRRLLRAFELLSVVHKQELPVPGGSERHRAHWIVLAQRAGA